MLEFLQEFEAWLATKQQGNIPFSCIRTTSCVNQALDIAIVGALKSIWEEILTIYSLSHAEDRGRFRCVCVAPLVIQLSFEQETYYHTLFRCRKI